MISRTHVIQPVVGKLERVAPNQHVTANSALFRNLLYEVTLHSPLTRLPHEILAHVFELCVVGKDDLMPVTAPAQGVFCLAQVCKLWRAVHLYFGDKHRDREKDVPRVKSVFDLYLKRSGTLPISLTFNDHRVYHYATLNLVSLLVDQLRTHSRRWKRISLHLPGKYFMVWPTTFRLNLQSAPNLKSFAYSGPGPRYDSNLIIHWKGLAEVLFDFRSDNIINVTLSDSLQFRYLAQCQNLTTCTLGVDRTWWLVAHNPITLPVLRTLRIHGFSPFSSVCKVIDPLILPQLQTLDIEATVGADDDRSDLPWQDGNLTKLLKRSGCALRHLSIQNLRFPSDKLVRCLELSPTLTSLRFIPFPRSQDIMGVIHRLNVSHAVVGHGAKIVRDLGPLVPELGEITLGSWVEGDLNLMVAMFRSRIGIRAGAVGIAALRRVEVVLYDLRHGRGGAPGDKSDKVTRLRTQLARLVSENEDEQKSGRGAGNKDRLDASVIVYPLG